jgi:hypothetical protein
MVSKVFWIPFLFGVFWGQRANMVFLFSLGTGVLQSAVSNGFFGASIWSIVMFLSDSESTV